MKTTTLIFYGKDGAAAKARAAEIRSAGGNAQLRQAMAFDGEREPFDVIEVLPDVGAFDRGRIEAAYAEKIAVAVPATPTPPAEKPKLGLPPPPPSSGRGK